MKKEKVCCNLMMVDMYAYNPTIIGKANSKKADKTYYELQTIETSNGFVEKLVEVDYPITKEYVASFEQSANYKNDIDGAIANGTNAPNLGDITAYQDALKMDTELISSLADRLKKANELLAQKQTQTQTEAKKEEVNNG